MYLFLRQNANMTLLRAMHNAYLCPCANLCWLCSIAGWNTMPGSTTQLLIIIKKMIASFQFFKEISYRDIL